MLILPAEADEATVSTAVDRIAKVIAPSGGEITNIDRWGRKRFAYEIGRQTEGYYVVVRFTAEPEVLTERKPKDGEDAAKSDDKKPAKK